MRPLVAETCRHPLPVAMADFEVQVAYSATASMQTPAPFSQLPVATRPINASDGGFAEIAWRMAATAASGEAERLVVRSSLAFKPNARPPAWVRMPSVLKQPAERARLLRSTNAITGEWLFHDACVSWDPGSMRMQLAQASPMGGPSGQSRGVEGVGGEQPAQLLWPLEMPPFFVEYVGKTWVHQGYPMLKHGMPGEAVTERPLSWHAERTGFAFSLSLDNLWHVLWHAVPMREYAERVVAGGDAGNTTVLDAGSSARRLGATTRLSQRPSQRVPPTATRPYKMRVPPRHERAFATQLTRNASTIRDAPIVSTVSDVSMELDYESHVKVSTPARPIGGAHRFSHLDILPHYTYHWPNQPKGEPTSKRAPASTRLAMYWTWVAAVKEYMVTPGRVSTWTGWELAGLSLMGPEQWVMAANRTQDVLAVGKWHCYPRLYGGHDGFFPHFARVDAWRAARPRIAAFRRAVLSNIGLAATDTIAAERRSIIFSLRRLTRVIKNEADVVRAVMAEPSLSGVVKFMDFGALSLRGRMRRPPQHLEPTPLCHLRA